MKNKEEQTNYFKDSLFVTPIDQKFTDDLPQSDLTNQSKQSSTSEDRVQSINKTFGLYYPEVDPKIAQSLQSNSNKLIVSRFLRENWELRVKISNESQRLYYAYLTSKHE